MNFQLLIAVGAVASALFGYVEWRRSDRRHLWPRLVAVVIASAALILLGFVPSNVSSASKIEASLWTSSTSSAATKYLPLPGPHFALPGVADTPADATIFPDAATLRRRFPNITALHLFGDGLDPADLPALRGLRVTFHPTIPAPGNVDALPVITFLSHPRQLAFGNELVVQGSLSGLQPGAPTRLTLEAPDGVTTNVESAPADSLGTAVFTLRAAPVPAPGHFLWRLHLGATSQTIAVNIVPPTLPRVLLLEDAPHFDTAALRRWYGQAGGTITIRTQLGPDRYKFSATHDPASAFTALTPDLLAAFDLVLTDAHSLLQLPAPERDALQSAVSQTGLGVLVLADDAVLSDTPSPVPMLLPWRLVPLAGDAADSEHLARLQWPGRTAPDTEVPLPSAAFEIKPTPGETVLLLDRQGHALAAAGFLGLGRVGLTLVRDTARWQRENQPAAFANYWSSLFTRLSRPTGREMPRWTLASDDGSPLFVDSPLQLAYSGSAAPVPLSAMVITDSPAASTNLALAPDPARPNVWRATFWPRHTGWHRVALASGGPSFDFYVHAAGDWPALAAARRRSATERFAQSTLGSAAPSADTSPAPTASRFSPITAYLVFLLAVAYLWIERRFAKL